MRKILQIDKTIFRLKD